MRPRSANGRALALSPDQQWALVVQSSPKRPPGSSPDRRRRSGVPAGRRDALPAGILLPRRQEDPVQRPRREGGPAHVRPGRCRRITEADRRQGDLGDGVSPDGRLVAGGQGEGHVIYAADGSGGPRSVAGAKPRDVFRSLERRRPDDRPPRGRGTADGALSPGPRDRTPRALDGAGAARHDGVPAIRPAASRAGRLRHARRDSFTPTRTSPTRAGSSSSTRARTGGGEEDVLAIARTSERDAHPATDRAPAHRLGDGVERVQVRVEGGVLSRLK